MLLNPRLPGEVLRGLRCGQPANVEKLAAERNLEPSKSFRRFMTSPELQRRVRSCTACYLDPGQRVVETTGMIAGHLMHFLSDLQSFMHWYLHLAGGGWAAVLTSPNLYCYCIDDPEWPGYPSVAHEQIDLRGLEFFYCAPSFSEFLYRFWIENEIWFALVYDKRPLKPLEYLHPVRASDPTRIIKHVGGQSV